MARQNVNDCYVKEFWTASAPLEAERGCFTFSVLEKRETLNRDGTKTHFEFGLRRQTDKINS